MTSKSIIRKAAAALALALAAGTAAADEPTQTLTYEVVYTADVQGVISGGSARGARYLHNIDLVADLDLEQAFGWRGASLHGYVLNNADGAPNDLAGTLQGVDNIEVALPRTRLFELWLEQAFANGKASVRGGLYNLNSEFYANDSAALLIAPSFGIGSELAATGPNGPSIFPSTGLGLRVNAELGDDVYVRAAAVNAHAGVVGDPGGVDLSFADGVLGIAEIGRDGPSRFAIGLWRYSEKQEDIRDLTPGGDPALSTAQGVYVLGERRIAARDTGRETTAFFRAGLSDGDTTPFRGGWQAGVRIDRVWASRPDSAFSVGVQQGRLSPKFGANLGDLSVVASNAETGIEVTYADTIAGRVVLQPDLQWIHHPGGDREAADAWVMGLRMKVVLAAR